MTEKEYMIYVDVPKKNYCGVPMVAMKSYFKRLKVRVAEYEARVSKNKTNV